MRFFLLLFFYLFSINLGAQEIFSKEKRDNIWLFGGRQIRADFESDPVSFIFEQREIRFDFTNASICDTSGNLLLYTNGISIANFTHDTIENGGRINPGEYSDEWELIGYPLAQGALILPAPNQDSVFYIFYEELTRTLEFGANEFRIFPLYYAYVDMRENNNEGKVIEKDIPVIQDTLDWGKIVTTRHANGRDWWVIIPEYISNRFYRLLITNEGIEDFGWQAVGDNHFYGLGQSSFAANGKKYINYNLFHFNENYLNIYDYDRCTGLFNNPVQILDTLYAYSGGAAISENSRFLYTPTDTKIYQYDLEAEDIEASKVVVAEYDGYYDEIPDLQTRFFMAALAPDGKIYISANNSSLHLHVIHEPNKKGLACNVEQHGIELPAWNQFTMPNFPYYGLGPLDGSPCDTLGIDNPPPTAGFEYVVDSLEVHDITFFNSTLFPPDATDFAPSAEAWFWSFGDGTFSNQKHPFHNYVEDGIYEVCLTATNYAGSDIYCDTLYINVVATEEPEGPIKKLNLYPNPVSDVFYISYLSNEEGYAILYDSYGREVKRRPLKKGNILQAWNACELVSGVYFLKGVVKGKDVFIRKIIKH